MYTRKSGQIKFSDDFFLPFGGKLNKNNRWVKLAELIPWEAFEADYIKHFKSPTRGERAFPVRVALGTLIIQTKLKLVDEQTPEMIMENPYLQYFLGFDSFEDTRAPFDASLITHFRKRFPPDVLMSINERIVMAELSAHEEKEDSDDDPRGPSSGGGSSPKQENSDQLSFDDVAKHGKLILDATCAPSDIRYPTDLRLLNEAREKLEKMIDILHEPDRGVCKKPRTYRRKARQAFLSIEKQRKKRKKALRKAIRKQLGYVRRNLAHIENYLTDEKRKALLCAHQLRELETIGTVYQQQQYMYDKRTHSVEERIVSISQPHVRPIVRGKAGASVEFGCKVMTSVVGGYALVEHMDFDGFNEGILLQDAVRRYYERFGFYPEAVLADTIFRNRENRKWLKDRGIRISGPKLGRKPKTVDPKQKQIEREDNGQRNQIEGSYGVGKRKYGLDLIKAKLEPTSKTVIILQFLVMNLDRRLRSLLCQFINWLFSNPYQHATA